MAAVDDERLKQLLSTFTYRLAGYWHEEYLLLNILKDASPLHRYNSIKEVCNGNYPSALHKAVARADSEMVEIMLEGLNSGQIFELVQRTGLDKMNVLHCAARSDAADAVTYLLFKTNMSAMQKSELLSAQDQLGNTALHYAAEKKNQKVVRLILDSLSPKQQLHVMCIKNKKKKSVAEKLGSLNMEIAVKISEALEESESVVEALQVANETIGNEKVQLEQENELLKRRQEEMEKMIEELQSELKSSFRSDATGDQLNPTVDHH